MSLWRKREIKQRDNDNDELEIWHVCMTIMAFIGGGFLFLLLISLIALWIN